MNTRTGAAVAGPSLALAACVSAVLAPANLPGKAHSHFLSRFLPRLFGGLAGCALTGKLKHGRLEPVDGIRHKLDALRDSNDLRRAVVPKENANFVDVTAGQSILDPFTSPVEVCGRRSILTALWSVTLMRSTWLFLNLAIVWGTYWGATALPGFLETHYLKPYSIKEVRTSQGRYDGPDALKKGIKVRNADQITFSVIGHDSDGPASLFASCMRGDSDGTERQSLRSATEGGDWRSEVITPIRNGVAAVEFRLNQTSQDFCSELSLAILHRGREMLHVLIPVNIVDRDQVAPTQ
jgi:hypothetical protein